MAGVTVDVDVRIARRKLKAAMRAARNLKPAYEVIGEIALRSVMETFRAEGRPERWEPRKRKRRRAGKLLQDTLRLKNSIEPIASRDGVVLSTNVIYAASHHFGDKRLIAGRKRNIPARPFMLIQRADEDPIRKAMEKHLAGPLL